MNAYILLLIVGSNIGSSHVPRYESLVSIQQEYSSKLACETAMGRMLAQIDKKADLVAVQCTSKNI